MAGEISQNEVDKVLDNAKDGKIDTIDAEDARKIAEVLQKATPPAIENFFNDETCSPRNRENLQCIMEALAGRTDDHKESLGDVQKTLAEIAKTTGTVIPEEVAQKVKPTASATENGGTWGGNALVGGTENAAGGSGSASATNAIDAAQPGIEHAAPDSLQWMINGLNDILPKSLKMVDVTPEKLREQALTKLEMLIRGRLSVDKQLLKIKNNEKRLAIIDAIVTNVTDQMKQGNRTDNFIMSSMYLSTEMLKQKNNAYANKDKKNDQTFNIGMLKEIGQTIQSSDDIIKFAMSGNLNSWIDSKLNTIADKVQTLLPSKFSIAMGDAADIREKVQKEEFTQWMAELFAAGSNLDFNTIPASLATMNTMMGNHVDISTFKNENSDLTKLTKENIHTVLGSLPTNDLEKSAAQGEILEAKFGQGTFGFVLDFLKQHGLMDMAMSIAKMFGFGDQVETLSLPKERRELKIATDAYMKADKTEKSSNLTPELLPLTGVDEKDSMILRSVNIHALNKTLDEAKKFLKLTPEAIAPEALKTSYTDYLTKIGNERKELKSIDLGKPAVATPFTYKDIFTSERVVADNFIMYLKTGKMPDEYEDKDTYLAGIIKPKAAETPEQIAARKKAEDDAKKTEEDRIAAENAKNTPATGPKKAPEKAKNSLPTLADRIKPVEGKVNTYTYTVQKWGSPDAIKKAMAKQFPDKPANTWRVETTPKNGKTFWAQEVVTVSEISLAAVKNKVPDVAKDVLAGESEKPKDQAEVIVNTRKELSDLQTEITSARE